MSPLGLRDISGEQWLFGAFRAADSSYSTIQEMDNIQRGSESGNNQLNSFLQGGENRLSCGRRRFLFLTLTLVTHHSDY